MRRTRITIYKKVETRNSVIFDWELRCKCWGHVDDSKATTRYLGEVYPDDRVEIGKETFEIVSVVDRIDGLRLVELGLKKVPPSRLGREPPRPRGIALRGFLERTTNTATGHEEP